MRDPRMWEGRPRRTALRRRIDFPKRKKRSTYTYVGSRGNLESLAQGERTQNWFPREMFQCL
jgi:hypothetical protein